MTSPRLVRGLPSQHPDAVLWLAPLLNFSGYASEARAFVAGLNRRGVPVAARHHSHEHPGLLAELPDRTARDLHAALDRAIGAWPVVVEHCAPGLFERVRGGSFHVGRTMFETDDLHPDFVRACERMDELWVPSSFNVETFRAAGVRTPIHVMPGGVDPEVFHPGVQPAEIPGARGTVFLSVFEWRMRKGWDVLVDAWAEAFGAEDDVTLVLRTDPVWEEHFPRRCWEREVYRRIAAQLALTGRSLADVAEIVVLPDPWREVDKPRLYAAADVYVGPSRGEGWGLTYTEAMASGLPAVATGWGGNLEFMADDVARLVDVEALEVVGPDEYAFMQGQSWARPSTRHLAEILRELAGDAAAREALGARARRHVLDHFTWDQAVDRVAGRLAEIQGAMRRRPSRPRQAAVRWVGEQLTVASLAQVNRQIVSRLSGAGGFELELDSTEVPEPGMVGTETAEALAPLLGPVLSRPADVEVRHQWPPDWTPPEAGAWVVVQPWELGGLPDSWVGPLVEDVDEVWLYSRHLRDCYAASGVPEDKIRVIPLGVDLDTFRPVGEKLPLRTSKGTRFLFVGGTIWRKGIDVLLAAYTAAFTPDDDVCLVVKSTGADSFYRHIAQDGWLRELAARPDLPEIEVVDADLSPGELAALYRSCSIYVHPYRGEGFGMPLAEAMAAGLPVIATSRGPILDLADEDSAYLVPAQRVPVPENATGQGPSSAGYWVYEPDVDVLATTMRHVATHPDEASERASRARRRIEESFTWERTARLVSERLSELASATPVRHGRPDVKPWPLDTGDRYAFLHQPDWRRPVVDQVVTAYVQAFQPHEPAVLVLWLDPAQGVGLEQASRRVLDAVVAAGADADAFPEILLLGDEIPVEHLNRLYAAADAVVAVGDASLGARGRRLGRPVLDDLSRTAWRALAAPAPSQQPLGRQR